MSQQADFLAMQSMKREINKLRRELAVQKALIARLTQLPSILSPSPLHKPVRFGKIAFVELK